MEAITIFRALLKSPFDLRLEKRGWIGTSVVLALLYGVFTPLLEPSLLPSSASAYLIVLATYGISFLVFFRSPEAESHGEVWGKASLLRYAVAHLLTSVSLTLVPAVAFPIFLAISLLAAIAGPLIYISTVFRTFRL